MIIIGLTEEQKQYEIKKYVKENGVKNVIVFSPEKIFMKLPKLEIPIRQIGYKEIIMYRTFYPLLEEIDKDCLLVANELMRDSNRNCLTYNCYAKYTNQTPHRMVFNYHPIISEKKDVMILIDFDNSQMKKGFGISSISLDEYDIRCVKKDYSIDIIPVPLPNDANEEYEKEKERLFNEIGSKNPDTIPRNLHIWTGRYKVDFLNDDEDYVARNQRFKRKNISVFKNAIQKKQYTMIDIPIRQLYFNDFLRVTEQEKLRYLSTGFNIDNVYIQSFENWRKELTEVYAETGVYTRKY